MDLEDGRVNDWHSQLNATRVARVETPRTAEDIAGALAQARGEGLPLIPCGGRHAMGGQQFRSDGVLLDTGAFNRVLHFDPDAGTVEVEAGIQWPELVRWLLCEQEGQPRQWGIIQKQTGVDAVSIGGSLAANMHSRGLKMKPIIGDVVDFTLLTADGTVKRCSRTENRELFGPAIGGYGLFGVILTVKLRLQPRFKIERVVEMATTADLMARFDERIAQGYLYGDCQYSCDEADDARFLREGVFPCYRALPDDSPLPADQLTIDEQQWREMVYWGHIDKDRAYAEYRDYYLASSGQTYWSDTHQLIPYDRLYHRIVDERIGAKHPGTEMIAESMVPRPALRDFMEAVRADFLQHHTNAVYGTIRLIERDDESFLAWAREPWVCIIFNIHVDHTPQAITEAEGAFRRLIDRALERGGTYFPTYHRWATREQVLAAHPAFPEFLRLKRQHDPNGVFSSDWYEHHRELLAGA